MSMVFALLASVDILCPKPGFYGTGKHLLQASPFLICPRFNLSFSPIAASPGEAESLPSFDVSASSSHLSNEIQSPVAAARKRKRSFPESSLDPERSRARDQTDLHSFRRVHIRMNAGKPGWHSSQCR
ncbi:hypothetical protein ABVK25_001763 [Lepraria finkii]|uniref:Uncharacterized protein n=1 Tax=Lepraria finkii TaxID=1340010 RepID=A0ABR4BK03_9LECA